MALDVQRIPIEIQFAQGLAGNEQKNRDKTLGLLKKFIRLRLPRLKEQLSEDEFIKLWKGMHYQLWMQDKPLIQEKLVDDICLLVHDFPNETYTLMFIKAFFVTEAREWFGLDQWRVNKFMMLVREFLHNSFLFLKKYEWKESICQELSNILEETVMNCRNIDLPIGLKLHLIDIFHYELRKVADQKLSSDTAVILLSPFLNVLPTVKNDNVMKKLMTLLFEAGGGQECPKERFSRKSDESDGLIESNTSQPKPYRLKFNKELLIKQLMEKGSSKKCPAKIRSQIYKLVKRIRYLENHPQKPTKIVKEKDIDLDDVEVSQRDILAAVRRLKKNKEELLEKVPLRKEYKLNLLQEKKSKKASKEEEIKDADTEEDDGIDMEGYDDDDDSLEFDAEAEFFQMSTEDEDNAAEEDLNDDNCLPNDHAEDEPAENGELESPVVSEQESPVTTKKSKKLGKAGSKRKNEESLDESVAQAPEKKGKKKKVDDNATDAVEDSEEMEVAVTEEKKSKKKKRKSKRKSGETSVSSEVSKIKPMFGMVDFPEEEESVTENMNETEVVMLDMQKSPEEDSKSEEKVKKKVKKLKQKKTKKAKLTKEPIETNDESEVTAELIPFPLPIDAKDTDVSNIETQNALQLLEHMKKLKEKKENKQQVQTKKKGKGSQVNRYFNQVQNEVDSKEMEAINSNVVEEEKDSPIDQEKGEEMSVPVNEVEVPVTEEETKTTGKNKLKISLVVKGKKGLKIKGQKVSEVEEESVKPEPELDSSEEWDKLYEHPPAFLRNAVAKAGKKKSKKSKNVKTEKSASPKKTTKTSVSSGGKHVSFNMEQNKALAFCVGTRIKNDENAFHPSKKPENGILKPSPSPIRISKKFSMDKKLTMLAKSSFMAHFF